jgi:hypothetical protein
MYVENTTPFYYLNNRGNENPEGYKEIKPEFLSLVGLSETQQNAIATFYRKAHAQVRDSEKKLLKITSNDEKTGVTEMLLPALGPELWLGFEATIRANAPRYTADYLIDHFRTCADNFLMRQLGALEVRIICHPKPLETSVWSKLTLELRKPDSGTCINVVEEHFGDDGLHHWLVKDILAIQPQSTADAPQSQQP